MILMKADDPSKGQKLELDSATDISDVIMAYIPDSMAPALRNWDSIGKPG